MSSVFDYLVSKNLLPNTPAFLKNNVHYECMMGSVAYGVSDDTSDIDVYGFCIPPKKMLFPYSYGYILGFGKQPKPFQQLQHHHVKDIATQKEYDITIYNITKFFNLCLQNNPNMVDALFVPTRCVLHSTQIGEHVRNHRRLFLSKQVWHKFKGYAFGQLTKMHDKQAKFFAQYCKKHDLPFDASLKELLAPLKNLNPQDREKQVTMLTACLNKLEQNGNRTKRLGVIAKHGYDTKFAYHVVRLIDECQQILEEGDLDLTRSRKHLKLIRNGEWSEEQVIAYFDKKLIILEELYAKSKLPTVPNQKRIKSLLFECLEMHYGNVEECMESDDLMVTIEEAYRLIGQVIHGRPRC